MMNLRKHKWVGPPTGMMDAECERCGVAYDSDDWNKSCEGPRFVRERRYAIIKFSDMAKLPPKELKKADALLDKLSDILDGAGMEMRNCVVVEEGWPEYEPTWARIESRWYREQLLAKGKDK